MGPHPAREAGAESALLWAPGSHAAVSRDPEEGRASGDSCRGPGVPAWALAGPFRRPSAGVPASGHTHQYPPPRMKGCPAHPLTPTCERDLIAPRHRGEPGEPGRAGLAPGLLEMGMSARERTSRRCLAPRPVQPCPPCPCPLGPGMACLGHTGHLGAPGVAPHLRTQL